MQFYNGRIFFLTNWCVRCTILIRALVKTSHSHYDLIRKRIHIRETIHTLSWIQEQIKKKRHLLFKYCFTYSFIEKTELKSSARSYSFPFERVQCIIISHYVYAYISSFQEQIKKKRSPLFEYCYSCFVIEKSERNPHWIFCFKRVQCFNMST